MVTVEIHTRIGKGRLRLCEVRLCLQKCTLILARVDAVECLSRMHRLPAGHVFLDDIAGDTRLYLYLICTHDLSGVDVCQRRILPQNIHRLDGSGTCATLLFPAAACEYHAECQCSGSKCAKSFPRLKQINNLLFPFSATGDNCQNAPIEEGQVSI